MQINTSKLDLKKQNFTKSNFFSCLKNSAFALCGGLFALLPFLLFAIISFSGNFILLPLYFCFGYSKAVRYFARDCVRSAWSFFLFLVRLFGFLSVDFSGIKNILNPQDSIESKNSIKSSQKSPKIGRLIIANHPSLLDVVLLLAKFKRANCVLKPSLIKNPCLFGAIKCSGYIAEKEPERLLEKCINTLLSGEDLILFPEATRTNGEKIIFHKAASYIAIAARCELCGIFIEQNPRALRKNEPWYKLPRKIKYNLTLRVNIFCGDFLKDLPNARRVRALHEDLNRIYNTNLTKGD